MFLTIAVFWGWILPCRHVRLHCIGCSGADPPEQLSRVMGSCCREVIAFWDEDAVMAPRDDHTFLMPRDEALRGYYDKAATAPPGFRFLSPTALEDWGSKFVDWICRGRKVCEIGPGQGVLALRTLRECRTPLAYSLVDISRSMLDEIKARLGESRSAHVVFDYCQGNIEVPAGEFTVKGEFDRLIAINLLQDVNAAIALQNMRGLLKSGSPLWVTFISKEAQDQFWSNDDDYDPAAGVWFASSAFHQKEKVQPMGSRQVNGKPRPFYRILHCYTETDVRDMLAKAGFAIRNVEPIIYPVDYVKARWNSEFHRMQMTRRQVELMQEWGGYRDGWSVQAVAV